MASELYKNTDKTQKRFDPSELFVVDETKYPKCSSSWKPQLLFCWKRQSLLCRSFARLMKKSANTSEQYRQFTQFTNYIIVICIIFLSGQNIYPLLWTRSLYNIFIIKILYNICITFFLALTYLPYLSPAFFEHEICANQLHTDKLNKQTPKTPKYLIF